MFLFEGAFLQVVLRPHFEKRLFQRIQASIHWSTSESIPGVTFLWRGGTGSLLKGIELKSTGPIVHSLDHHYIHLSTNNMLSMAYIHHSILCYVLTYVCVCASLCVYVLRGTRVCELSGAGVEQRPERAQSDWRMQRESQWLERPPSRPLPISLQ